MLPSELATGWLSHYSREPTSCIPVTDWEQKTALAISPTSGPFDACKEHTLLIAPVMVNINSHAINNCTRTTHNPNAWNKLINHQSQPLHNRNVSYRHTVIHVYLFILLLLIFVTVLSFSQVCWLSCVANISASSISASASWRCTWF